MRDRKSDAHRGVVEKRIGRKLTPNEVVDHINEDKTDNADANLRVKTRGKHTADHNRARPLSRLRKSLRMVKDGSKLY
jgi:hypothetical protein